MNEPLILDIKGNSLDDGPGIRSVVFFKGCPLSCLWCHNPESKRRELEISYDPKDCVHCDTCMETCPENALSPDNPFFIDRKKCTLCMQCVEACPSGALSRVGTVMEIDAIVRDVARDKPFFKTSGGGVTLSGGEPTLSMDFLSRLVRAFREQEIHVLVETCGMFRMEDFLEKVYPHIDAIYMDIKIMDKAAHQQYCGTSNEVILKNFKALNKLYQEGGVEILPRTPLIPGITDSDENIGAVISFLQECGVKKADLLPYHPLWQEKNFKIGIKDSRGDAPAMQSFLDKDRLQACREAFLAAGIQLA
ncbi:glycyl-radical enzyme activating protein [Desulfatibacillum aliphaticivorans]|uniref:glycyl-radical enzyme activating protein n=1 Tax=Desulfatibacillum aliphaticivorans TaxID=218208 RepID=UPI0004197084|nr:glycyl-radical enzyme activating protein [Desulfatibacillum aliphaticivorans]